MSLPAEWQANFARPPADAGTMMRWWWFGTAVTEDGIDAQLRAMAAAGITGVELAFVYPLTTDQEGEFLSAEHLAMVRHAAARARELGMRFDVTLGSGWSYGGTHVPLEHASRCLRWEERSIPPGAANVPLAGRWPGDLLVAAFVRDGALEDRHDGYTALRIVDDVVQVPAGTGPRTLLVVTSSPTGQQVKRSANGAEGYVLDHHSRAAVEDHLAAVGEPLLEAAGGAEFVRAVFSDSLETYLADWTPAFVQEFRSRRGYDPLPLLFWLRSQASDGAWFRADYHRTLSELCEENFLAVIHEWAEQRGVQFRVQNYGHPPARVSGFRHAHLIEGEGWDWLGIPQTKWAASAAHHLGSGVVSSETWTWNNSPSFRSGPLDFKGEAHEHMLSGINQFIGHGWPYSPADAPDPGWAFYASTAITDRNAWWHAAAPSLFGYLSRCSWALRQGEHVADIGVWLPYDDTYADFRSGQELNLWKRSAERITRETTAAIRHAGYDFDVIDAETDDASIRERHRVIVLSHVTLLREEDVTKLRELAERGVRLVFVESPVAEHFPHPITTDAANLPEVLAGICPPDALVHGGDGDVGVVHRRLDGAENYFVANTGASHREVVVEPRTSFGTWDRLEAHTGVAEAMGQTPIRLELAPYQAFFVVTHHGEPLPREQLVSGHATLTLSEWDFEGPDGLRRVTVPHRWEAPETFTGSVSYSTTVHWHGNGELIFDATALPAEFPPPTQPQSFQARTALPFTLVAEVFVNDEPAGVLWDPPFTLEISEHLRDGENTLRLVISGTSVPAMRSPAWQQIYEDAEAHFGRRFAMQDMDQLSVPVPVGLFVAPKLRGTDMVTSELMAAQGRR